jgi:hypothetical protein
MTSRDGALASRDGAMASRDGAMASRGIADVVVGAGVAIVIFLLSGIFESNSVVFWENQLLVI